MSYQASGFKAWFIQRISAVYLGVMVPLILLFMLLNRQADYPQWMELLSQPLINFSVLLFFYAMFVHAWVGVRDIIIDYIHLGSLRILLLVLLGLSLIIMTIWISLVLLPVVQL